MEVVASLSQGRTAAAQCGLFTYKSVPVIFEPPCTFLYVQVIFMNWCRFWLLASDFEVDRSVGRGFAMKLIADD